MLSAPRKQDAGPSARPDGAAATSSYNPPPPLVVSGGYDDEIMSATSAASSPRSHFSDDTIDLIPSEPLAQLEGPPTTTPLLREDTSSPPPAYSRSQPADSIWPAPAAAPPSPPNEGRAVTLTEAQPLSSAWAPRDMEQVQDFASRGYGTLVQVNNYGGPAPGAEMAMRAPVDADSEWQHPRGHRHCRHGRWRGRGRGRRGRGSGVPDFGRFNCRCCCCACMCSRLTIVVVGLLAAVFVVLFLVALCFGLAAQPKEPRSPESGSPLPAPGRQSDCLITICLPRFVHGEGPCKCLLHLRKAGDGSESSGAGRLAGQE